LEIILSVEGVSSSTEPALPPFMDVIGKLLVPYQALSLVKIPLAGFELVKNTQHAIKAPKYLKVFPLLKTLNAAGSLLDGFIATIGLAKHFGSITLKTVSAALGPIGGAAIVLHLAKGGTSLWSIYRVDQQWKKFGRLLGKSEGRSEGRSKDTKHEPTEEEYKAAFDYLTKEWKTGVKTFDYKFFALFKTPAQEKISKIYDRFGEGALSKKKLETTIKTLRDRYIHKQAQHALEIALMIIGSIGTLILIFAPTPAAPAAWGLLASSGVLMGAFYLYKYLQKKQFTHDLKGILETPKSLPSQESYI
jgi:hypothetical protein